MLNQGLRLTLGTVISDLEEEHAQYLWKMKFVLSVFLCLESSIVSSDSLAAVLPLHSVLALMSLPKSWFVNFLHFF